MKILRNLHISNNHTRAALSFNIQITTKTCTRQTQHITGELSGNNLPLIFNIPWYSKGKTNTVSIALSVTELLQKNHKTKQKTHPQIKEIKKGFCQIISRSLSTTATNKIASSSSNSSLIATVPTA